MLTLRCGIWEQFAGLYFKQEHLAYLGELGVLLGAGKGFVASYIPDNRTLCFQIVEEGGAHLIRGTECDLWPYRVNCTFPHECARFEIDEVNFKFHKDTFFTRLAPDHKLPWPKVRNCRHAGIEKKEIAYRELGRRMHSAVEAGQQLTGIPQWVQEMMTREDRVRLFTTGQL